MTPFQLSRLGAVLGTWDAFPSIGITQGNVQTDGWSVNVEASIMARQRIMFKGFPADI